MKIRFRCLLLLIFISSISTWSQITVGDLKYSISNGAATVQGLATDATDIVIPSTIEYNGLDIPVKTIAQKAFQGKTVLSSVELQEGIQTISEYAFQGCSGITEIVIPEGIRTISGYAFEGCSGITEIVIPRSITSIGSYAFAHSGIRKLHIEPIETKSISIGEHAFSWCQNLYHVDLLSTPDYNLKSNITFDSTPFYQCRNLKTVHFNYLDRTMASKTFFSECDQLHTIIIDVVEYNTATRFNLGVMFSQCNLVINIIVDQRYIDGRLMDFSEKTLTLWPIIKGDATTYYLCKSILPMLQDSIYSGTSHEMTIENTMPKPITVSTSEYTTKTDAGTYSDSIPIILGIEEEQYEYKVPFSYTIYPASLTATIQNATREYGEDNPPFNVTYTGFVNNETEEVLTSKGTVSTTATPKSDVGTYPVTLTGASVRNYTIAAEPATLTVTKAPLTAKASDVTRLYGQNNPQFTFNFTGLKNGETSPQWTTTPTLTTTANAESPVGLYPIEVSGGEAKNYEFTSSNGTLTVNKAELTIAADNKSRPYFEENPTLTCKYTGFVNGENSSVLTTQPTLKTNAEQASNAGNYPITVSGAEAQNYSIVYKQGNMEVTKRQLTVSTNNYSREYKEENPKFELRYMGFVNNETEDVLINKPTATTQATVDSDAGVYPITISGGVAANYDFLYAKSNLTIEKTYQTLSWTQEFEELEVYSQTELKAKTTSELDVTYTIVSGEGASISKIGKKTFLECMKAGTIVICAQQTGNNNYYESNKVYKTIRVGKANPSDVNGDNVIDSADIVAVIKEMPDGDMKADVNGDGVIDSADIVAVIKAMK